MHFHMLESIVPWNIFAHDVRILFSHVVEYFYTHFLYCTWSHRQIGCTIFVQKSHSIWNSHRGWCQNKIPCSYIGWVGKSVWSLCHCSTAIWVVRTMCSKQAWRVWIAVGSGSWIGGEKSPFSPSPPSEIWVVDKRWFNRWSFCVQLSVCPSMLCLWNFGVEIGGCKYFRA